MWDGCNHYFGQFVVSIFCCLFCFEKILSSHKTYWLLLYVLCGDTNYMVSSNVPIILIKSYFKKEKGVVLEISVFSYTYKNQRLLTDEENTL